MTVSLVRTAMRAVVVLAFLPMTISAETGWVAMSDSARLHYRVAGHGADTIIAIHGGTGMDHESIYGDFTPLAARHTVIFYDQRRRKIDGGGGYDNTYAERAEIVWPEVETFLNGKK